MTKDLTEGRPSKLILSFAIPVLGGYLFQQFYNLVDTIIVGKCLSVEDLAAVGSTGSVIFLIIGMCMGITSGFAIPVAQCFGAKNYSKMRQYIYNAIIITAIFAVLYAILTVILCKPLLRLMQTPPDIIDHATDYVVIIFAGIPFGFFYNFLSAIMRSLGDSKTPLYFLIFSSILNIALDLITILVFNMGVQGAAYATIASQAIAGFLCLIYVRKKFPILKMNKEEKIFSIKLCKDLCSMGIPMGLQYSITAIGSVILQASVNTLGSASVASMTAGLKIHMFFCAPFDTLGTTMATYSGQNIGARKFDRIRSGLISSSAMGLIYSAFAFAVLFFVGDKLCLMFLDSNQTSIIKDAHQFLISNSAFYFFLALVNIIRFMIQGMGFSKLSVLSGVFEMIARSYFGFFLVPKFGFIAATLASPAAWILADVFLIIAFFYCFKKVQKMKLSAD